MIQTWQFPYTGTIPGIPGEWHTGLLVDVDTDTNTVVATRLANTPISEVQPPPETQEDVPAPQEAITQESKRRRSNA